MNHLPATGPIVEPVNEFHHRALVIEGWDFSGAWSLEFGATDSSRHRNLFRHTGLEIPELDPNLFSVAHLDLQSIQAARRRTGRVLDLARYRKRAVVAGAEIVSLIRQKIHGATGMRANDIKSLHLAIARAAQVNRADGGLLEFIPGIHPSGHDWK